MTAQEQSILDTQIKGVTVKIVWGFICSICAGTLVACACYFGLKSDIALMKKDIANLQEKISEMRVQSLTKNQ